MAQRFPPTEPYQSGMLDVSHGQRVYWECCGNPIGKAALYLHGGPGSGCTPGQRHFFDPSLYRAVLFDQRGSGRSRPLANDLSADLSVNTTAHLVADIEVLREFLRVDRWTILGLSWGTTLALAYAQAYPHRVRALVLGFITTTSKREVQWATEDIGRLFPREWERFAAAVPNHLRHLRLVDAYASMLADADSNVREHAALEWCLWEDAHISLTPGHLPNPRYEDPEFRFRFARLVTHYWRHAAFLDDGQLMRNATRLIGIPGILIHGRFDVSAPLETAWRLSQRWTTGRLHVLDDAGHGGGNDFTPLVHAALAEFGAMQLNQDGP
jgi:proline iminopeptidase